MNNAILTTLASGVHGDVVLCQEEQGRVVLKVVQAPEDGVNPSLQPHNIAREAALLTSLRHLNIVEGLDYTFDVERFEHVLKLEVLSLTLSQVLTYTYPHPKEAFGVFHIFAKGVFSALTFLHARGIAHRDIKPANVMLSFDGCPKLIDFGTVWEDGVGDGDGNGFMVCQVGTGPYRAPELLFSPERYDPQALDLWSAGVMLAEFFRPLVDPSSDSDSSDGSEDIDPLDDQPSAKSQSPLPLFNATYGELGLAASIFKQLGTPTPSSWPTFSSLPDASKLSFDSREPRPFSSALVLDEFTAAQREPVISLLASVVCLEPSTRKPAAEIVPKIPEPPQLPPFLVTLMSSIPIEQQHRI